MPEKKDIETTRRRQILDAAEKVFAERGIDKARMDDIVQEAGLSKGALYWYFKSKDALIRALLDRVFMSEMREAEALVNAQGSSGDRLRQFAGYTVEEYKRFKKLLLSIQDKTMQEQQQILEQTFVEWKGERKQIDDVLVMGVKV